jgi:DNA-binding response OmpR family regulator
MRLLIAEDDVVSARLIGGLVNSWGYDCRVVDDGEAALKILQEENPPPDIAILDWVMPGVEGVEVCRRVRERRPAGATYMILLTSKDTRVDVVDGLESGADDYLVKPFNPEELHARVRAGARIVGLQRDLMAHIGELSVALANVRRLSGLLPICAYCKSIRDDSDYWHRVEEYVTEHSEARFSHGICPNCLETIVKPQLYGLQPKP